MARILLGVTGGIAAYKAVELVRLATKAGHAVRVVQTPDSLEFVGRGDLRGRSPARPVLVDEFEPDPARGAYPGRPGAGPRPDLAPRAGAPAATCSASRRRRPTRSPSWPHGLADNLLTSAALASPAPLVLAPGDEQPHVGAPRHARQPRRRCARAARASSARARARWPRRASAGVGRLAEPAGDPRRDRGGRSRAASGARCDGLRVLVTAGGTREPIDSVRYVGNRSSGRMGLALAAEAARRGADVTLVGRQRRRSPAPAGRPSYVEVETAAELLERRRARPSPTADVLLMAAAVADFRPAERARRQDQEERARRAGARARADRRTCWPRSPPQRRAGQTLIGFAAEHGDGRGRTRAASSSARGSTRSCVNDISRAEIGFDSRRQRGHDRHGGRRAARSTRLEGGRGGRDPRRGRGAQDDARRDAGSVEGGAMTRARASYDLFKQRQRAARGAATSRRPRSRSSAPARSSPTRARSARRSAAPTSARAASTQARRGVRRGRRAPPGQRLRPLLPRPLAREDRPHRRGAPPRRARRLHAARPHGLQPGSFSEPPSGLSRRRHPRAPARAGRAEVAHATAPSTTRPSRRSSAVASSQARRGQVGVHPDVARARAAEADQPRLAVPPEQHPGVESLGRRAARTACARSRPSARRSPTSSGSPPACSAGSVMPHSPWASRRAPAASRHVGVHDLRRGHSGRVRTRASAGQRVSEAPWRRRRGGRADRPGLLVLLGARVTGPRGRPARRQARAPARVRGRRGPDEPVGARGRGELLVVSQFTLYGDAARATGRASSRPPAGAPSRSTSACAPATRGGVFGARMHVRSYDGPVTLLVEV